MGERDILRRFFLVLGLWVLWGAGQTLSSYKPPFGARCTGTGFALCPGKAQIFG
jgi:hypothetical protein